MNSPNLIPSELVYPLVYGNEEETGMLDNFCGEMEEPYLLAGDLGNYIPSDLRFADSNKLIFLQNGAKIYAGGAADTLEPTNIERATPECRTPQQLATYIRAGELLLLNTVQRFLVESSQYASGAISARIQRRVVDSLGSRKASHDNYGVHENSEIGLADELPEAVLSHLASRSFITGAGHVSDYGLRFAQKIDGLKEVMIYNYVGSMYRYALTEGSPRVEIRCSDINLSDWAAKVRIGSTAISLALNNTPLADKLMRTSSFDAIMQARRMNKLSLNDDGTITATPDLLTAIDFQQQQTELALDRIQLYTDPLPDDLYEVARDVYQYCMDFKAVLNGDATIALLADRADWAAKFQLILLRMNRDRAAGKDRDINDIWSEADDLKYDYIGMSAKDGVAEKPVFGRGYVLRDKNRFGGKQIGKDEVLKAYYQPPKETRAAIRSHLISNYMVESCNWHVVLLHDEENKHAFRFPDVLQHTLTPYEKKQLSSFKRIRP